MTDPTLTGGVELTDRLASDWPVADWKDVSVLAAVSGGADSVALLHALHQLRNSPKYQGAGRILVGHFNHRWRGSHSDEDEHFVTELCATLELEIHIGRATEVDQKEEVARNERYEFLQGLAEKLGARYLVTAHTIDDQAETILHRILRGTGIRGLSGIRRRRQLSEAVTIVRPLLGIRRQEICEYLNARGLSWREDSSNADVRFTRNRIRHELLPYLEESYNPAVKGALIRLGTIADEVSRSLAAEVLQRLPECVFLQNDRKVELDRSRLLTYSCNLQREIVGHIWRQQAWPEQAMGYEQWDRIATHIASPTSDIPPIFLPGSIRLTVTDKLVQFIRTES